MRNLVSITIPVFERTEFFREALDSALRQSVSCPIIVVDNNSSHSTFKEEVVRHQDRGRNVTYAKQHENTGLFGNWNACAKLAKSEYFVVLCDDDVLEKNYIEDFVKIQRLHPQIELYATKLRWFGKGVKEANQWKFFRQGLFTGNAICEDAAKHGLCWPTNSTVYRTALIRDNPWRNPSPIRHSNADWHQIYSIAPGRICYGNPKPLYNLRVHDANAGRRNVYATLTQAEVFFVIAEELRKQGKVEFAHTAYVRSATCVLNCFLLNPTGFSQLVQRCLADGDPFVEFIHDFWGQRSRTIRSVLNYTDRVRQLALWMRVRSTRYLSRFSPGIFESLAMGDFKRDFAGYCQQRS